MFPKFDDVPIIFTNIKITTSKRGRGVDPFGVIRNG